MRTHEPELKYVSVSAPKFWIDNRNWNASSAHDYEVEGRKGSEVSKVFVLRDYVCETFVFGSGCDVSSGSVFFAIIFSSRLH